MSNEFLLKQLNAANVTARYRELIELQDTVLSPDWLGMLTDASVELTKIIGASWTIEAVNNCGDAAKVVDAGRRLNEALTAVTTALDDLAWVANE